MSWEAGIDSSVVRAHPQEQWEAVLQGQLSVLLLHYPFHSPVTAVARKRSQSFCQKCRWQVTAENVCHPTYVASTEVTL